MVQKTKSKKRRMKKQGDSFEELSLGEQVNHVIGRLIVSLGEGNFNEMARMYLLDMHGRGYRAAKAERGSR